MNFKLRQKNYDTLYYRSDRDAVSIIIIYIGSMKMPPKTFKYCGDDVMSNFDHIIDKDVEGKIKGKSLYAYYPGWNFHGIVWFDKRTKKWRCLVSQFHVHVETIETSTLQGLMSEVCKTYGYE